MDYVAWVKRLEQFLSHVKELPGNARVNWHCEPPVQRRDMFEYQKRLRVKIPAPVMEFISTASGGLEYYFTYAPDKSDKHIYVRFSELLGDDIYGGLSLCNVQDFEYYQSSCHTWAFDTFSSTTRKRLLTTFPFCGLGNGDCCGVVEQPSGEAPVFYLRHEDSEYVQILSRSFDHFLMELEYLCYIQPWFWRPDVDLKNVELQEGDKLEVFQQIFRL